MIYTEIVTLNGVQYQRTCSDTYMIERDGELYSEALDPIDSGRAYEESKVLLAAEASEEDYQAALEEMGVRLND